jgi:LPS export ABC transporter protein LptC
MQISQKQSKLIALSIIGSFFLVSLLMLTNKRSRVIPSDTSSDSSTPSNSSVVPTLLPSPEVIQSDRPGLTLKDFHRVEHKNGKKVWEIKARQGNYDAKTGQTTVSDAELFLFQSNGDSIFISSPQAILAVEDLSLNRAALSGGVKFKLNEDLTALAPEALFDKSAGLLTSAGPVQIITPTMKIEGKRLKLNLERKTVELLQNVSTVVLP